MENEPALIRDQMQDTRTALTEKLESLQASVTSSVESATSSVTETVQSVKDAVQDTVGTVKDSVSGTVQTVKETVKDAFDLPGHVERHPWVTMLGCVAAGYAVGRLTGASTPSIPDWAKPQREPERRPERAMESLSSSGRDTGTSKAKSGGGIGGLFNYLDVLSNLTGIGVSTAVAVARDVVTKSVPGELGERISGWMNEMTEKAGFKPMKEPILPQEEAASTRESEQEWGAGKANRPQLQGQARR